MKKNTTNKKFNNLTIDFLVNNLKLENINVTPEEKLICKKILEGKINVEEYKKVIMA